MLRIEQTRSVEGAGVGLGRLTVNCVNCSAYANSGLHSQIISKLDKSTKFCCTC